MQEWNVRCVHSSSCLSYNINNYNTILFSFYLCTSIEGRYCERWRRSESHAATLRLNQERVVLLGSGWGRYNMALNLSKDIPLTVVSPSNHFVFTPLLPSTAVGTLEFRCIKNQLETLLGHRAAMYKRKLDVRIQKTRRFYVNPFMIRKNFMLNTTSLSLRSVSRPIRLVFNPFRCDTSIA